jgi:hypothetical protein
MCLPVWLRPSSVQTGGGRMCPEVTWLSGGGYLALGLGRLCPVQLRGGKRAQARCLWPGHLASGLFLFSRPARIFPATDGRLRLFRHGATVGAVAEVFFFRLNKFTRVYFSFLSFTRTGSPLCAQRVPPVPVVGLWRCLYITYTGKYHQNNGLLWIN